MDKYFRLMIWDTKRKGDSPICIETGIGSIFLQRDEIQKLVQFLIINKEKLGYRGEL